MTPSYTRSLADDRARRVAGVARRARLGGRPDLRLHPELRRHDHPAHHRDPPGPAAARDQAGQVDAAHADRPAEGQADPGEVQGEQAASAGRDHEALQGVRGQPVLGLLAGAAAVPDPDRDVLGAAVAAASDPVPTDSGLYEAVSQQIPETLPPGDPNGEPITTQDQIKNLDLPGPTSGTSFLGMNLLCSAIHAGNPDATLAAKSPTGKDLAYPVDCGSDVVDRIPYYVFAVLMFGTTFFQQRQMQQASPPGASSQQQALLKVMPIVFG